MNTSSNGYVLGFAVTVCIVMSTALALTANSLKETQDAAADFDRQKNVMTVAGLIDAGDPRSMAELQALYQQRVEEKVVDLETGKIDESISSQSVSKSKDPATKKRYRVIAIARDEQGKPSGFVLPIQCKGLWGPMFGYLALESDANTVRGITFYQHKETPGLGGEVDNLQWKASWKGKKLLDDKGDLVGVRVKKGKVDPSIPNEKLHYVDGLSGATITSLGVTRGLAVTDPQVKSEVETYRPYLSQFWDKKD
jgi:Na+-transporting NADH:ubiquinone oxidoreductase subunit C